MPLAASSTTIDARVGLSMTRPMVSKVRRKELHLVGVPGHRHDPIEGEAEALEQADGSRVARLDDGEKARQVEGVARERANLGGGLERIAAGPVGGKKREADVGVGQPVALED